VAQAISQPPAEAHIACCGLFCTNCGAFKKGKCQGCQIAPRFARCAVRACCAQKGIANCAACPEFAAPRHYRECPKLYNFIARAMAFVFRSDRLGALTMLRDQGEAVFLTAKRASGKM
jgi:hypothetical protein